MIKDPNRIYDGFSELEGGVDAGRRANVINPNQVVSAENIVFRGGKARTRPGISLLTEVFKNPNNSYNPNGSYAGDDVVVVGQEASTIYKEGVFQGAVYFSPHSKEFQYILAMIGGRLFKVVPKETTVEITEISLPYRNRSTPTRAYMIQADKYIIIQDGESLPIIFDGSTARRAEKDEVFVGTIMAYGMGRIVVVKKNDIFFGDLYGSKEGDDPADSIIKFTETTFLNEGFPAAISTALGSITAAAFVPQLDTSTGLGELLVFTSRGAASFFLSLQRENWKQSQFQKVALMTTGVRGWRSISIVNEDLFFRADDGERSFRQARAEPGGWHHLPLSTNVSQWFGVDTPKLLEYANSIYFDNRIIMTCTPIWNRGRMYHNGLIVLDFDILSSFGVTNNPAWNGHWSGVKTTQLVVGTFDGKKRAFAFGLDEDDENILHEITTDQKQDYTGKIPWELVTRSFDFSRGESSSPFIEKELYGGDVWLNNTTDPDSTLAITYRPDGYDNWLEWGDIDNLEPIVTEDDNELAGLTTSKGSFAPRRTLPKPASDTDPTTKRNLRRGFEFQAKMNGVGSMAIERFRLQAQQIVEKSRA